MMDTLVHRAYKDHLEKEVIPEVLVTMVYLD